MSSDFIKVGNDRKISFDKKLRFARQLNYNIDNYETVDFEFKDAGKRRIYKNFNFNIFINKHCNADCKFCIAQLRYQNMHEMYTHCGMKDVDKYLGRLEEVLKMIRPLNPSVSITGGEPTLCSYLTEVLKLIDKYDFRKRTITTNGSGLFAIQDNDYVINNLIKYNYDYVNISRASYDDIKNREIMRFNSDESYCSMDMMREILNATNISKNLKHRISCLLLKDGVNSVSEMKKYIDFYNILGANNFIFRELMDYDDTAINQEKIEYCTKNKIRLNDIWGEFDVMPEFVPYLNILGYYYYVEIYKYHGLTVASESADLVQQTLEKSKHPDVVYEMVFHENGNLNASWIDNKEVLDEYHE